MGSQPYELMTARQAADALDLYLAERASALRRLRTALAGPGPQHRVNAAPSERRHDGHSGAGRGGKGGL